MVSLDGKFIDIGSSLEFGEEVFFWNNLLEILNVEEMLEKRLWEFLVLFELMFNFFEVRYIWNDMLFVIDVFGKLYMINIELFLLVVEG